MADRTAAPTSPLAGEDSKARLRAAEPPAALGEGCAAENHNRCRMCLRTDLTGSVDRDGVPSCWMDADLCSTCDERRELATAAAHQAVEAAAELLRYAREGDALEGRFDIEAVEKLLDAAKMAGEIEGWPDDKEERGQVYGAIENFLSGWAD